MAMSMKTSTLRSLPGFCFASVLALSLYCCQSKPEFDIPPFHDEFLPTLTIRIGSNNIYSVYPDETFVFSDDCSGELEFSFRDSERAADFIYIKPILNKGELTPLRIRKKNNTILASCDFLQALDGELVFCVSAQDPKAEVSEYRYHFKLNNEEDNDEPQDTGHDSMADISLSLKKYIQIDNSSLNAQLSINVLGENSTANWQIELLIDNKPIDFFVQTENEGKIENFSSTEKAIRFLPRSGVYQIKTDGLKLELGKHDIRILVSEIKTTGYLRKISDIQSSFRVFKPQARWYYDAALQNECGEYNYFFNESTNSRFYLKLTCEGADGAMVSATVRDITEGKTVPTLGDGVFVLSASSRGEHRFSVKGEIGDTTFSLSLTKIIKDEYRCCLFINNDGIYATTSGPKTNTADFTTNFTFYAVVRAVIPYTEAIIYAGDYFVQDKYEYENFQWVGTDFVQWSGTQYGQFVLQKGWIQTGLSWARGKMSGVSARTNGASRWVKYGNRMEKEYYTPVPYLEVAAYVKGDMSNGSNLDYAIWSFRFDEAIRWLNENGVSFHGYLL